MTNKKSKKESKESGLVRAFLYSPLSLGMKFPCHCGLEMKMFTQGSSGSHASGSAECENGHKLLVGVVFVSEHPSLYDKIIPPLRIRFQDEPCAVCGNPIGEDKDEKGYWVWKRDYNKIFHGRCFNERQSQTGVNY